MLLEDQRQLHEDLERLEDAAAERLLEDPPHVSILCSCRVPFADHQADPRPSST